MKIAVFGLGCADIVKIAGRCFRSQTIIFR